MENNPDLAKWLAGEMTKEELDAFEKTAEFTLYNKIKEYSGAMKTSDFNEEEIYQNIILRKKEKTVIKLRTNWMLKISAVLVIGLSIFFLLNRNISTTEIALNGQRNTFLLPDNSEIVLNSGSEINYKKGNWENNRNLNLKGEAFFKVAKGEKFVVNTDLGKVTVVGTQFNVKSRGGFFIVECYEGKVKVDYNKKTILLKKGESISIKSGKSINTDVLASQKPSWMLNEIKFNSNSLEEVISELERQYNVSISQDQIKSVKLFTGMLPQNNLKVALEIVSKTFDLKTIKTAEKKFILISDDKN